MNDARIFISYSRADEKTWLCPVVNHLQALFQEHEIWSDKDIEAGADWRCRIDEAMAAASVAILLVSVDFLRSKFIKQVETTTLLERQGRNELQIFPLIVRHCPWRLVPWLEQMQVLPDGGQPLDGRSNADMELQLTDLVSRVARTLDAGQPAPPNRPRRVERATSTPTRLPLKDLIGGTAFAMPRLQNRLAEDPLFARKIVALSEARGLSGRTIPPPGSWA